MCELLWDSPDDPIATLLLAHGAGAAMDSAGMNDLAGVLEARGIRVARFEFDYMAARRQGIRRPPPRADTLTSEYLAAVERVRAEIGDSAALFIGGRSMGFTYAQHLAAAADAARAFVERVSIRAPRYGATE